jgi:outer membrane immunogenic protein
MKQLLLGTVALTVLATAASAADMAPRYAKAPAVAEPIYNWTGFYVGLNAGALSAESDFNVIANGIPPFVTERRFIGERERKTGWLAGGQIGYNYQTGMSVFGIEADGQWTSNKFTADTPLFGDPFFAGKGRSAQFSSSLDWLVTVRGRAGVAATPSLLLYVTGGVAVASANIKYTSVSAFAPFAVIATYSGNDVRAGWTAGFGAEYALGGGWSVKGEYLRVNFDSFSVNFSFPTQGLAGPVKVNTDLDIIRAGINYKFGGPVVARY